MKRTRRSSKKHRKTRRRKVGGRRGGADCNPRPEDRYPNLEDDCPAVCDNAGQPLRWYTLSAESHPEPGVYIYVIRESEPDKIYYTESYAMDPEMGFYGPRLVKLCRPLSSEVEMYGIHHTCVAKNNPVIAAGELVVTQKNRTLYMDNESGHYKPKRKSLDHVKCLVEKMGYRYEYRDPEGMEELVLQLEELFENKD